MGLQEKSRAGLVDIMGSFPVQKRNEKPFEVRTRKDSLSFDRQKIGGDEILCFHIFGL